jgi:hypothetical protein
MQSAPTRLKAGAPVTATIESAEAFERLLVDGAMTHDELVGVRAPAHVWWSVLDLYPHSAAWVAANLHLPAEVAEHLAQHCDVQVRAALASGHCMSPSLMMQLAHDKSEMIRLRVVCNAHTTLEALLALSVDPCQVVAAHAHARLTHDLSGIALPPDYLEALEVAQLLLH